MKSVQTWISTDELAARLGRKPNSITKAARRGKFGSAAARDAQGGWQFQWPQAADQFRARTDPTRVDHSKQAAFEPPRPAQPPFRPARPGERSNCMIFRGRTGKTVVIGLDSWERIRRSAEDPEAEILTPQDRHALILMHQAEGTLSAEQAEAALEDLSSGAPAPAAPAAAPEDPPQSPEVNP